MKPPPPMLPARGRVTASAKPTATAASTALPPSRKTSSPTRDAAASWVTTMPCLATTGRAVAKGEMIGVVSAAARAGAKTRRTKVARRKRCKASVSGCCGGHHRNAAGGASSSLCHSRRTEGPTGNPELQLPADVALDSRSVAARPPGMTEWLPYFHHRAAREARAELPHIGGKDRDAAGGGREISPREMKEDGAASPLGAAREILVEDEGHIVEMIVAPHAVRAVGGGQSHGAIVARARRILAPALVAPHGSKRHARGAGPQTVRPVIAPEQPETPGRGAMIALALQPYDSRGAERASDAERPRGQPATSAVACKRPDAEKRKARRHSEAYLSFIGAARHRERSEAIQGPPPQPYEPWIADKGEWGKPLPTGTGRGLAIHEAFGTIVGEIAEVSVDDNGRVKVERVVACVDCGHLVNPLTAAMQIESAVLYGLTAALFGEITIRQGRVEQGNFDSYPIA